MGLVANSGEQMHALLYVSLFLFLGKLPLIVIERLTFLHSMLIFFWVFDSSLSRAAISLVFTRFVFSDQRNKED